MAISSIGGLLTGHDEERCNVRVDAKQDIRLEVITDHDCALGVKVVSAGSCQCYVLGDGSRTYAAMMVSIMCLCGLPMIVGVFLVEYRSGADIDPEPVPQMT